MRKIDNRIMGPVLCAVVSLGIAIPSVAQADDEGGIRAGSFLVHPQLVLGVTYDDNVFVTNTNTVDDTYFTLTPSVSIESDFASHSLNFDAYSTSRFYSDQNSEDSDEWGVGMSGTIDVSASTLIEVMAGYEELTEGRDSTNRVAGGAELTEYSTLTGAVFLNQRFNRVTAAIGASYTDYDYNDTPAVGGGVVDGDFRDHDEWVFPARLSYEVSPDTSLFVRGEYNIRTYDQQPPAVVVDRDSDGYNVGVGAAFDFTNLIAAQVWLGYMAQDYSNPTFQSTDGLDYGLDAAWTVTSLTTVTANVARSIEESTGPLSSGHTDTDYRIGVSHELLESVVLSGDLGYSDVEFEGITRSDEIVSAGLGVTYAMNRNVGLALDYDYVTRDSTATVNEYNRSIVGFQVILKL